MKDYPETRARDSNTSQAFDSNCTDTRCPEDPHFLRRAKPVWQVSGNHIYHAKYNFRSINLEPEMYSISLGSIISQNACQGGRNNKKRKMCFNNTKIIICFNFSKYQIKIKYEKIPRHCNFNFISSNLRALIKRLEKASQQNGFFLPCVFHWLSGPELTYNLVCQT